MDISSTPTPNTISQDSQINKPEVQLTQGQAREPKKQSSVFIIIIILILLSGIGFMGYLYLKKDSEYKKVTLEKQNIESEKEILTAEKSTLESENATLKEENASIAPLQEEIDDIKAHEEKIKVYKDVIDYVFQIVKKHSGFNGWTDAEYQEGRRIAEAAGDEEFLEQVDSAWNDKQISQLTRFLTFMDFVCTRIDDNLTTTTTQ
jgi:uncharacterized protein HemX